MGERRWRVRLGAAAEVDFANILKWTTENFGARQSRIYRDTLVQAIREVVEGPDVANSKPPDEIMPGSTHAPHCATRTSRTSSLDELGRGKKGDRNRPHPARQHGSSAPHSIGHGR